MWETYRYIALKYPEISFDKIDHSTMSLAWTISSPNPNTSPDFNAPNTSGYHSTINRKSLQPIRQHNSFLTKATKLARWPIDCSQTELIFHTTAFKAVLRGQKTCFRKENHYLRPAFWLGICIHVLIFWIQLIIMDGISSRLKVRRALKKSILGMRHFRNIAVKRPGLKLENVT